jgi:hypothetical protein
MKETDVDKTIDPSTIPATNTKTTAVITIDSNNLSIFFNNGISSFLKKNLLYNYSTLEKNCLNNSLSKNS